MKNFIWTVPVVVLLIAIAAVFGLQRIAFNHIDQYVNKYIKSNAIAACHTVATATWVDKKTGATIVEPYAPAYEKCVKDQK